jgi:hypothetical protein
MLPAWADVMEGVAQAEVSCSPARRRSSIDFVLRWKQADHRTVQRFALYVNDDTVVGEEGTRPRPSTPGGREGILARVPELDISFHKRATVDNYIVRSPKSP